MKLSWDKTFSLPKKKSDILFILSIILFAVSFFWDNDIDQLRMQYLGTLGVFASIYWRSKLQ